MEELFSRESTEQDIKSRSIEITFKALNESEWEALSDEEKKFNEEFARKYIDAVNKSINEFNEDMGLNIEENMENRKSIFPWLDRI